MKIRNLHYIHREIFQTTLLFFLILSTILCETIFRVKSYYKLFKFVNGEKEREARGKGR